MIWHKFYISIVPEDDYKHGVIFRYDIYEIDYDDHFNLKRSKTGFLTHNRAVDNAALSVGCHAIALKLTSTAVFFCNNQVVQS